MHEDAGVGLLVLDLRLSLQWPGAMCFFSDWWQEVLGGNQGMVSGQHHEPRSVTGMKSD
jgi:hypothetical protein